MLKKFFLFGLLFSSMFLFAQNQSKKQTGLRNTNELITEKKLLLENAIKEQDLASISNLYADLGQLYKFKGEFDHALVSFYQSALAYDKYRKNTEGFAFSRPWLLVDIGNILFRLYYFEKAIEMYTLATAHFYKKKNTDGLITSLNNTGLCLIHKEKPLKSISYFRAAKKIGENTRNLYIVALCNVYLGDAYEMLKQYNSTLQCYQNAESFYSSRGYKEEQSSVLLKTSNIYCKMNMPDSAFALMAINKKLFGGKIHNPIFGMIVDLEAKTLLGMGKADQAIDTIRKYLISGPDIFVVYVPALILNMDSVFIEQNSRTLFLDNETRCSIYLTAFRAYKEKGLISEALRFHEAFSELSDSIQLEKVSNTTQNIEYKIRSEALINQISHLEEKEKWALINKNYVRNLLLYFVFTAAIMVIVFLRNRRRINYRNLILLEYLQGISSTKRFLLILAFGAYNILFFYFFKPLYPIEHQFAMYLIMLDVLPGIMAFLSILVFFFIVSRIVNEKTNNLNRISFYYAGIALALITTLCVHFYFYKAFFTNQLPAGFVFSMALVILASLILPFSLAVIILENFTLKKIIENAAIMSESLKEVKPVEGVGEEILFKSSRTSDFLSLIPADLIGVQAQANYCRFYYLKNGKQANELILIPIKQVASLLSGQKRFIRCHNSYIVNIDFITKVIGNSRGYQLKMKDMNEMFLVSRSKQNLLKDKIRYFSKL
ncbi:MAG: LytTR family DNA-binding domain-containing protein [Bacteroidota bacterium]